MSYGISGSGNHSWALGESWAHPFIRKALKGGRNFFDTANVCSGAPAKKWSVPH
jgi:1-deoxyxylulose-5-phosphate synthase